MMIYNVGGLHILNYLYRSWYGYIGIYACDVLLY